MDPTESGCGAGMPKKRISEWQIGVEAIVTFAGYELPVMGVIVAQMQQARAKRKTGDIRILLYECVWFTAAETQLLGGELCLGGFSELRTWRGTMISTIGGNRMAAWRPYGVSYCGVGAVAIAAALSLMAPKRQGL